MNLPGLSKESSGGGKVFLSVFDGFFELKLKDPAPGQPGPAGAISRVNKNQKTIWVDRYKKIEGQLRGIVYKNVEKMGEFCCVLLENSGRIYQLDLSTTSGSTFQLLSRFASAKNLQAPIRIEVSADVKDNKKKTSFFVYEQGSTSALKGTWTKEHPNGCPDLKEVVFQGKKQWDNTDQNNFVKDYVAKNIVTKIKDPILDLKPVDVPQAETAEVADAPAPEWLNQAPPIITPSPGK